MYDIRAARAEAPRGCYVKGNSQLGCKHGTSKSEGRPADTYFRQVTDNTSRIGQDRSLVLERLIGTPCLGAHSSRIPRHVKPME